MNRQQKAILVIGLALIIGSGIYPPWVQSWELVTGGEDVLFRVGPGAEGYSWIFRPPGAPTWVDGGMPRPDDKEITGNSTNGLHRAIRMNGSWRAGIDVTRLFIEWAMITAGVLVGTMLLAEDNSKARSEAALPKPGAVNITV